MFDEKRESTDVAIKKIVDNINQKRREELLEIFSGNSPHLDAVAKMRKSGQFKYGSKSKVWRKVASMPLEVDRFFTAIYGEDYYKDKDFFKHFPEWLVVDPKEL